MNNRSNCERTVSRQSLLQHQQPNLLQRLLSTVQSLTLCPSSSSSLFVWKLTFLSSVRSVCDKSTKFQLRFLLKSFTFWRGEALTCCGPSCFRFFFKKKSKITIVCCVVGESSRCRVCRSEGRVQYERRRHFRHYGARRSRHEEERQHAQRRVRRYRRTDDQSKGRRKSRNEYA